MSDSNTPSTPTASVSASAAPHSQPATASQSNQRRKGRKDKLKKSAWSKGPGNANKKAGNGPPRQTKGSLMDIARTTLERIEAGYYNIDNQTYDLSKSIEEMKKKTEFFGADDAGLVGWRTAEDEGANEGEETTEASNGKAKEKSKVLVTIEEVSTLAGARTLSELLKTSEEFPDKRVGVLNFASAKNPGGGFLTGAQAQEESIARSSTIYPSLMTDEGQRFYRSHRKDNGKGYYSHAMIYTPSSLLIRSDNGDFHEPVEVDMLTSCAVNAGVVRRYLREAHSEDESGIDEAMKERMGRVLRLFEKKGVRNLVLGSFGTGVFRNRVELVAHVWKELLVGDQARFSGSFDHVVFAILGSETFVTFQRIFGVQGGESEDPSVGLT